MSRITTSRSKQRKILTPRYIAKLTRWLADQDNMKEAAKSVGIHAQTFRLAIQRGTAAPDTVAKLNAVIPE